MEKDLEKTMKFYFSKFPEHGEIHWLDVFLFDCGIKKSQEIGEFNRIKMMASEKDSQRIAESLERLKDLERYLSDEL